MSSDKTPLTLDGVADRVETAPAAPRVDTDERRVLRWGLWVLLAGFGGFVGWATLAPLDAGVHAQATVKVASNRKTVQHLTGGTVDAIRVKEGQRVRQGEVLLQLNPTQAEAEQGVVIAQYIAAKMVEARLVAERDGAQQLLPEPALARRFGEDARYREALALQQRLFSTRRHALNSELGILGENLQAAEEQLRGQLQVQQSRREQAGFLGRELGGVRQLAAEGYVPKNRMLELERQAAQLNGAQAEDVANVGRTRNQIAQLKLQRLQREQEYQKEVQSQLTEIQKEALALTDRLNAIDYQVSHTQIRAPIDGFVVGLNVHTVGGVIRPGEPLMDVVPVGEPLLVDAQVPVQAIDKIHPDLEVNISFPAFNHAKTPNIPGRVLTVSADSLQDPQTHMHYYLAQVRVTPEGMRLLGDNNIRPGMPASVVIKTGERTMMGYLLKPLVERIDASFKEQ